jgi:hypothetical protein
LDRTGGVGYKNVKRARGYCFVMSGENSINAWRPFCVSTDKKLAWGEPVLVELDGYFNDLTRTFFVGTGVRHNFGRRCRERSP